MTEEDLLLECVRAEFERLEILPRECCGGEPVELSLDSAGLDEADIICGTGRWNNDGRIRY